MNKLSSISAILLLIVFALSCASGSAHGHAGTSTPHDRPRPKYNATSLEQKIHALINNERRKHGLSPLEWDDALAGIARKHSKDMGARNYFSHVSPEGHDFLSRYEKAGYACEVREGRTVYEGAENIFQANTYDRATIVDGREYYDWNSEERIAETIVAGWMKSTGHRKNILTPRWRKEGIGVSITPEGKVYVTQNFC